MKRCKQCDCVIENKAENSLFCEKHAYERQIQQQRIWCRKNQRKKKKIKCELCNTVSDETGRQGRIKYCTNCSPIIEVARQNYGNKGKKVWFKKALEILKEEKKEKEETITIADVKNKYFVDWMCEA